MRLKTTTLSLLVALLAVAPFAGAQDPQEDDVRGAFLTSRPTTVEKSNNTSSKPVRRRRKTTAAKPPPNGKAGVEAPTGDAAVPGKEPRVSAPRLGLGLTLFMRDSNGLAVRVDPTHEFQKGDRVRVLLETNADGYLYIFNTTDNGSPVMVYPNPQLDEAGNFLQAHVPFEIPSSLPAEDRLRWLTFDEHAGTERLYFVFTREPLASVPIEDELVKYCGDKKAECEWHPAADLWTSLKKEMEAPARAASTKTFGNRQTNAEQQAATRGIGLAKEDAEPSTVIMSASSGPAMLVTALELLHK
jgi:hypothetical protein